MISNTIEGLQRSDHPVTIIGAGPAGLTLALELERLGQRVLVLESGGLETEAFAQGLSDASFANQGLHDEMSTAVSRRLGGTSNFWGGRCVAYDPIDFTERPLAGDARWPIGLDEIRPHYVAACRYLSCGVPVFNAPDERIDRADGAFIGTALERWSNTRPVQKAHASALKSSRAIDIRLNATVVDIGFAGNGIVTDVTVARPDGMRVQVPVRQLVIAAGGLESARLLLSIQRAAPSRFGGPDGPLGRYYMGHVIGEIADITFADDHVDAAYDFYVDGNDSYVRRRFVPSAKTQEEHRLSNIALFPVVPTPADARHGSGILSMACLVMAMPMLGRMLVAEAIRQRHVRPDLKLAPHVANLVRDLPQSAAFAVWFLWNRYMASIRHPAFYLLNRGRRYGLSYHAEHLPNRDSRVRLGNEMDALGMPRLHIDLRFSDADAEAVARTHELFAAWIERNGLGRIEYRVPAEELAAEVRRQARHGTHQIGTVRMAASAGEGVVDRDLCTFSSPNLFVASSAVLPTSGQANPTLTIVALSVRLAQHLAQRCT